MRILVLTLMLSFLSHSAFGAAAVGADDKEVVNIRSNRYIVMIYPIDVGFSRLIYNDDCIYYGAVTACGIRNGLGELWNPHTKELLTGRWFKGNLFGQTQVTKHEGDRDSPVVSESSEWRANGSPLRVYTPAPELNHLAEDKGKGADRGSSSSDDNGWNK